MGDIKKTNRVQLLSYLVIFLLTTEVVLLIFQNRELKAILASLSAVGQMEPLKPGERVEAFKLQSVGGNINEFTYTDPAKKHLLFIFSTTCLHCEKTLPLWNEIVAKNTNDNCNIIGVSPDPIEETVKFASEKNLTFYIGSATKDTSFSRKYKIPGVPETILLSSNGTVEKTWAGELTPEQAIEIQSLMNAQKGLTN